MLLFAARCVALFEFRSFPCPPFLGAGAVRKGERKAFPFSLMDTTQHTKEERGGDGERKPTTSESKQASKQHTVFCFVFDTSIRF